MFGYEEINLHLIYSSLYLIISIILVGSYAYYVYRYTIPQVSNIFIDNSRSNRIDDGTNRTKTVTDITKDIFANPIGANDEVFLFGSHVNKISKDSLEKLDFDDAGTNISQVFSSIQKEDKNYSTITLITDGAITAGSNSIYAAKNLGLPIYTVGIGDTTQRKDISIKRLLYNSLLYSQTPTTIEVTLQQNGLSGMSTTISLYENNSQVEQKNITFNNSGIQKESFIYTPKEAGEKKLSVVVSELGEEFTTANNKKVFYIKVLSNKVKVLILAGKPSADLTFIKNALREDENFNVISLTQISKDKYAESETL
ncbi:MAG: hypothetical protein P8X73_12230, partial [Ignavibacteriaceae bacterium]